MPEVVQGVIHGKTIELQADPGIADGATVEVTIRPTSLDNSEARLAAFRRTAGALAWLPREDWDALDSIVNERQGSGRHRSILG